MKRHLPPENTARVIAVAVAFFGTFALLGWNAGVFAKLDTGEQALLAGFFAGISVLTYLVDGQVRRAVDGTALALRGLFNTRAPIEGLPDKSASASRTTGVT